MLQFILVLCLLLTIPLAKAENLILLSEASASGTQGQMLKVFSDTLAANKIKNTIKITNNNCALAKLSWVSSKSPILFLVTHGSLSGVADAANSQCFIKFAKSEIIFWVYSDPLVFCSAGGKTWQDFIKPETTHSVGIQVDSTSEQLLDEIAKKYNTKIRVVKTLASQEMLTLAKAGEIDFAFRSGIAAFEHFHNKCFWSSIKTANLPPMDSFINFSSQPSSVFSVNVYFAAKNITPSQILPILNQAFSSVEMQKINQRRGYDEKIVKWTTEDEYMEKMEQLFSIIEF